MPDPPALRVIPGGTGEIDDGLDRLPAPVLAEQLRAAKAAHAGLKRDLILAEENLCEMRASRAALKAQLTKLRRAGTPDEHVESLLVYWRNTCRGPESGVEIPLDGKRADLVRKTLKRIVDNDPDPELANPDKDAQALAVASAMERAAGRIRNAIDGCARFPFEGAYARRYGEMVPGSKRKDDIVYILRDEIKLEAFEHLHEGDEGRRAYAQDLWHRMRTQPQFRLVLASLNPEHGELLARAIRHVQANP
jgi:hypothetical protein